MLLFHTENCKLELLLDCLVTQVEKIFVDESSRRRGFADFSLEVFYIDFIEGSRNLTKSPFVLKTKEQ